MSRLAPALFLVLLAFTAAPSARARCTGDVVDPVVQDVVATCSCCGGFRRCATHVIARAVREHRLPGACRGIVRHAAAAFCRRVRPACGQAGGCLDTLARRCTGVPCRVAIDTCGGYNALCSTACSGPDGDLRWRWTCGSPACLIGNEPPNGPPCAAGVAPEAPCSTPAVACDPGQSCNALLVCSAQELAFMCPISRRAAKNDIDYLDAAGARRVHDALMRYPLATWRYRSAPDDARHLGFIIDDVAPSPAVAPDGAHVDLYGYTTMAVAALQVQAKEIAALRAEVAALRQALPGVRAAAGRSRAAGSSARRRSAR